MKGTPTDRAVTDVVGFVLTFSIIISAVTIIYIGGFGALGDLRDTEQVNSGERSMRGVAESLEDIHRKDVPGRSVNIGVDGGEITTYDSTLRFEFNRTGGPNRTRDVEVNALVFEPSDDHVDLVYEAGAVFRVQRQSSIIRHQPVLSCGDDAVLVSVPKLRGNISISGGRTVELYGRNADSGRVYPEPGTGETPTDPDSVTIDVSDTHVPDAWGQFLSRQDWNENGNGKYTCPDPDPTSDRRVYVRQATISLRTIF
jgi:hypothetical protein